MNYFTAIGTHTGHERKKKKKRDSTVHYNTLRSQHQNKTALAFAKKFKVIVGSSRLITESARMKLSDNEPFKILF